MLRKVAKFGGYSLNSFEVINFLVRGASKAPDLLCNKNEFQTFKTPTATAPYLDPPSPPQEVICFKGIIIYPH